MFHWHCCSKWGLSDWQWAKYIINEIPTGDTRMFWNCDIAGCEIQTGDMYKCTSALIYPTTSCYLLTIICNHDFFPLQLCCCTVTDIWMSVSWDWHFIYTIDSHQSKQVSLCTLFQSNFLSWLTKQTHIVYLHIATKRVPQHK